MYQRIDTGNFNPTLRDLVDSGMPIFNDWWHTYIPEHKAELERKFIHTYYFEQIGAETPQQFLWYLNAQLERIMPYYNQLYASELIKINPLLNHSITANGRSIENLVAKANTSDDKYAKAIREFAGITDRTGLENAVTDGTSKSQKDDVGRDNYTKTGTEDIKDDSNSIGTENEKTHETKVADGTANKTENGTVNSVTDKDNNQTVTETPGEVSTKKTDWGGTETTEEKTVGNDKSDSSGSKEWTETRDDDSTTDTTTNLSEQTISRNRRDYADTPQKQLDTTGDNMLKVRQDYLTNVTWTEDDSKHTADTTQNVTFKDDETRTHTENTSDTSSKDTTKDVNGTRTKGGTDTETTSKSGENITKTETTETVTANTTTNNTTDTTTKDTTNTDGTRDNNTEDITTATRDRDWTEKGESNNTLSSTQNGQTQTKLKRDSSGTDQTSETSDVTQSSVQNQQKTSEETADKGTTNITSGFMNVSSSALLEAFRKTFLNIDSMILEELRDNFMLVY